MALRSTAGSWTAGPCGQPAVLDCARRDTPPRYFADRPLLAPMDLFCLRTRAFVTASSPANLPANNRGARASPSGAVEVSRVRTGSPAARHPDPGPTLAPAPAHSRHQATPQFALLKGWVSCAAPSPPATHDSHNLVVLGRDANDMALAANQLIASSGGGMANGADLDLADLI